MSGNGKRAFMAGVVAVFGFLAAAAAGDPRTRADALWAAREDLSKAKEAIAASEDVVKTAPMDFDSLLRLSRLHYWIGQNIERSAPKDALAHYGKGKEYGRRAADAAPSKAGGYFFEAANLARENNLKGTFTNLFGIREVRKLNEKAASLEPGYFSGGPDRFFCAYYARLPGLFGGSISMAIEHGRRAVEVFPKYAGNRVYLAEAYIKDGKIGLARKELHAALDIPDDAIPEAQPEQRLEKKRAAALLEKVAP